VNSLILYLLVRVSTLFFYFLSLLLLSFFLLFSFLRLKKLDEKNFISKRSLSNRIIKSRGKMHSLFLFYLNLLASIILFASGSTPGIRVPSGVRENKKEVRLTTHFYGKHMLITHGEYVEFVFFLLSCWYKKGWEPLLNG
jgi:hypothetical protein